MSSKFSKFVQGIFSQVSQVMIQAVPNDIVHRERRACRDGSFDPVHAESFVEASPKAFVLPNIQYGSPDRLVLLTCKKKTQCSLLSNYAARQSFADTKKSVIVAAQKRRICSVLFLFLLFFGVSLLTKL